MQNINSIHLKKQRFLLQRCLLRVIRSGMDEFLMPPRHAVDRSPYDYTDAEQGKRLEQESSLRDDRLRAFEESIISTRVGREWLWGLLSGLHVHELRIAVSGSDFENGIWMGEYATGNRIQQRFAAVSPASWSLMYQENQGR